MRKIVLLTLLLALPTMAAQPGPIVEAFRAHRTLALAREAASIAREALRAELLGKPAPEARAVSPLLKRRAGVFVTLKLGDRVRGCMGNLDPRERDIAHEIAAHVAAAARGDARYRPVALRELPKLRYYISIIGPRRRVQSVSEIIPSQHGLLVEWNGRGGVLLPGEAKTARWAEAECRRKAGIPPKVPVQMSIFETAVLDYGP